MDLKALKREAGRASTSKERMIELVNLDPSLSREIAKYRSLHPDIVQELCKSRDMPTRAALAKNNETSLATLEILVKDPQWTVVKAILGSKVARKFSYSRMIFEIVARHKRHTVRQTAAEHPHCPPDLLEELSRDVASEVRESVADNFNVTPEILHRLASDPELGVVFNVATHVNTSNETLDLLAQHPNASTRNYSIDQYPGSQQREIPVSRLEMLKDDPDPDVLRYVLFNRYTPTHLIEYIFTHHPIVFEVDNGVNTSNPEYGSLNCMGLQHALRNHPNLNVKWVERIAQIHNSMLIWDLLQHPHITPEILETIAQVYLGYLEQHRVPDKALSQLELNVQKHLIKSAKFAIADLTKHEKTSQKTLDRIKQFNRSHG